MKPVARLVPSLLIAAFALSCNLDEATAPDPALSLHKRGNDGGNPCRLGGRGSARGPVDFLCSIAIPSPLTGSQKGWAEQSNAKYFLSDASASGVQVIDIRTHTHVGLIGGMAGTGTPPTGGGTAATNGPGPNAFVSVPVRGGHGDDDDDDDDGDGREGPNRVLFVSDGNSTVHVVNMDRLEIIASVSTAMPACDGGTPATHYCGRTNEISYDPVHHVVLVQNPAPLTVATPRVNADPYATFISAKRPYRVLGHITFPAAVTGNLEGHIWVPPLNRFLMPVQPNAASQATRGSMYIAVINSKTRQIEHKRIHHCPELAAAYPDKGLTATSTGNNNLQLGPRGHLLAQTCGRPIIMDVRTGAILNVISQVGTGDQDWYNPGDANFYVHGADAVTAVASLGVIDARSTMWRQNVPNIGGASPTAYARTNEIFTRVPYNAATHAASRCAVLEKAGEGCVVVFAHTGTGGGGDDDD